MLRKKSASADVEALLVDPLASRATKRFLGCECVVDNESDRRPMTVGKIPLGGVGPKLSTRGGAVVGTVSDLGDDRGPGKVEEVKGGDAVERSICARVTVSPLVGSFGMIALALADEGREPDLFGVTVRGRSAPSGPVLRRKSARSAVCVLECEDS